MKNAKKLTALLLLSVLLLLTFVSCSSAKSLVGTWKYQKNVLGVVTETVYTFNDDGTGSTKTLLETGFTYTVDGDRLVITTTVLGISASDEYTFKVHGDELELTKGGETITLTRSK